MNIKNILYFIGGIIVGGSVSVFATKKHFQEKYKAYYEEDRNYLETYYGKTNEYRKKKKEENEDPSEMDVSRPGGRMTPEERASVKEKLQKNYEQTTNYAAMYKTSSDDIDPAEMEHPEEEHSEKACGTCFYYRDCFCELNSEHVNTEDSCSDWEPEPTNDQNEVSEEKAFEDHQKNMNKPPKIISVEDYGNLPAHIDQQVLYFYSYDETLCDENEEIIEEPELLIGDALTKYNFVDSDESCIFVMNYATDTCYEIQKVDASYSDSH